DRNTWSNHNVKGYLESGYRMDMGHVYNEENAPVYSYSLDYLRGYSIKYFPVPLYIGDVAGINVSQNMVWVRYYPSSVPQSTFFYGGKLSGYIYYKDYLY